ncbi:MAG TPA: 4Fe-4S binding protein [Syntrophorhabdaceae bacterium]|nr:4Fe-4S binding protein [Syntrophorhabdaceae bacterium]
MSEPEFDLAELKKVGMIQQKQKEYFALRLHAVGGDFTADQMRKVIEVAETYGKGRIHLSTRQGIEIHFVHHTNLEKARKELESSGITMGACGPRIRIVTACPGEATCKFGIIETKEVAQYLDSTYFRQDTPYKFKLAVTGCPHNCAKANENDIGVMGGIIPVWNEATCGDCMVCVNVCPTGAMGKVGDGYVIESKRCINCGICASQCPTGAWSVLERGYILWLGGTLGKLPRLATRLPGLISQKEKLYEMIERAIGYYRREGRKKERFGHTLERMGVEKALQEIVR